MSQIPKYALTAILILPLSLISGPSLDIAIHDTYFVIAQEHIAYVLSLLFALFSIATWGFKRIKRPLNKKLLNIHFAGTALTLIILILLIAFNFNTQNEDIYEDYSVINDVRQKSVWNDQAFKLGLTGLLYLAFQLLFVVGMVMAILKNKQTV